MGAPAGMLTDLGRTLKKNDDPQDVAISFYSPVRRPVSITPARQIFNLWLAAAHSTMMLIRPVDSYCPSDKV